MSNMDKIFQIIQTAGNEADKITAERLGCNVEEAHEMKMEMANKMTPLNEETVNKLEDVLMRKISVNRRFKL